MRWGVSICLCAIIALATVETVAIPPRPKKCKLDVCSAGGSLAFFPTKASASAPIEAIGTNAQRLARGLGPKPPTRRSTDPLHKRHGPSPSPSPSPAPQKPVAPLKTRGNIAFQTEKGDWVGYMDKTSYHSGHVFITKSVSDALVVSFVSESWKSGNLFDIPLIMENWSLGDQFPLLGLIQGDENKYSDIGPHSPHYLTLGGVELPGSPPDSVPVFAKNSYTFFSNEERTSETSVWSINFVTGLIVPQWTNSDGSQPTTHMFRRGNVLYCAGDIDKFIANESSEGSEEVVLLIPYWIPL